MGQADMMNEWNKVWEEDALLRNQMGMQKATNQIAFQADNQYLQQKEGEEKPNLLAKAKELIEAGRIQEAILCLEAEVQMNKENAEAWRILGQLF